MVQRLFTGFISIINLIEFAFDLVFHHIFIIKTSSDVYSMLNTQVLTQFYFLLDIIIYYSSHNIFYWKSEFDLLGVGSS